MCLIDKCGRIALTGKQIMQIVKRFLRNGRPERLVMFAGSPEELRPHRLCRRGSIYLGTCDMCSAYGYCEGAC